MTFCSSFPKWLYAQAFQTDYLLKVTHARSYQFFRENILRRSFLEPHMVKIHKFCLFVLKLLNFPKWLFAHVFLNDFLLKLSKVTIYSSFPKWLSAHAFPSDYLLKISIMTFCSILNFDFQGLNFPLLSPQNGPKWPQVAPKGYPEYTWVIFWVTAQDLGLFGPQKGAKTDTEGHQSNIQGLNCQNL